MHSSYYRILTSAWMREKHNQAGTCNGQKGCPGLNYTWVMVLVQNIKSTENQVYDHSLGASLIVKRVLYPSKSNLESEHSARAYKLSPSLKACKSGGHSCCLWWIPRAHCWPQSQGSQSVKVVGRSVPGHETRGDSPNQMTPWGLRIQNASCFQVWSWAYSKSWIFSCWYTI